MSLAAAAELHGRPGAGLADPSFSTADVSTAAILSPAPPPRIGMVIGTYAALPYIHLQLEARKRYYPGVPTLIHDDGSKHGAQLEKLAKEFDAEFITQPVRHNHSLGDLCVYPFGIEWAVRRNVRFLLKISRRWIWRLDWRADLLRRFAETDAATLSNFTDSYGFGFRTECVAFDVNRWGCEDFMEDVQAHIDKRVPLLVEHFIHVWAGRFSDSGSLKWNRWKSSNPVLEERGGYAPWALMGTCRRSKHPSRIWHDSDTPEDYAAVAQAWELPYDAESFRDPNAGAGTGRP